MGALKYKVVSTAGALMRGICADRLVVPNGQVFDISSDLDDYNRCALFAGRYERFEIKLLRRYFELDDTIIEIGANIGVVARYAFLEKLKDGGTYICVEPNPNSRAALEANMRRAQALSPKKKFQIVIAAVSGPQNDGKAEDFVLRENLGSGLASQTKRSEDDTIVQVASRSLGSLMKEFAPNGASLICDVEGAEIPMILEDPQSFANIRQMVIELHEPKLTGRPEMVEFMVGKIQELGFAIGGAMDNCFYLKRG